MVKQISLDTWSTQHLQQLLLKATNFISQTNTPIVLYRETLEETEDVFEEIVCTLTQEHVIEQVIVSGGMVIPEIKQQIVFSTRNNIVSVGKNHNTMATPDKKSRDICS